MHLQLRSTRCLADVADEMAHILWRGLTSGRGLPTLDPHRFPGFALAIKAVVCKHVDLCDACSAPPQCDTWARTGGGSWAPVRQESVCKDHERQLVTESGEALKQLQDDLENEICRFISRNNRARAKFDPSVPEKIHTTVMEGIRPYLLKTIGNSSCDTCTQTTSDNLDRGLQ